MIEIVLTIIKVYLGIGLCVAFGCSIIFLLVSSVDGIRTRFLVDLDERCDQMSPKTKPSIKKTQRDLAFGRFNMGVLLYFVVYITMWPLFFFTK